MARLKQTDQLTPLELEIMKVLWKAGTANVQAVQQHLHAERPLAYTTVQTMLNVLVRKGKARRTLKDRAYVYRPALSRQNAISQAVGDLVERVFGGSSDDLVLALVKTRRLKPERLAELQKLIEQAEEEDHGKR